jgi:hypothetical protein
MFASTLLARRASPFLLASVLVLGVAACGDDAEQPREQSDAGGEKDADAAKPDEDSVIAVLTRVCGPDDCLHYLNTFAELPKDKRIDRSQGVESGNTQGMVFNGAVYIFDRDNTSVTKWTVDADLTPRERETVSFRESGVTDACAICNVFGTPDHAYMVDSASGVIVTWNPTSMEIIAVNEMPKSILERDGKPAAFSWPLVVGKRAFLAAAWIDYDTYEAYGKAAVATFDATADDPEVSVIEDDRCGVTSVATPFADKDGNVYVVGDWFGGLHQIGTLTPTDKPACLLRIKQGDSSFDSDYYVDLLATSGARAVAGAYAMQDGEKLLVNIWPEDVPAPSREDLAAGPSSYWQGKEYVYTVLDLATKTATPVDALPPGGSGNNTPLVMDGVNYIQVYPDTESNDSEPGSNLYAIRQDGSAEKALEAGSQGDFEMINRVR